MCRLLAWLGEPVDLESLLYGPPHSLHRQSWAPREQTHGTVNADGWGVGWYQPEVRAEPARYRTTKPMWGDANFRSMAGVVRSPAILAVVRSATPPSPTDEVNTPPFLSGPWLFGHNGAVDGWREGVGEALRRAVTEYRASEIQGSTDSEVLFALALDQIDKGALPADAVASVVEQVTALTTGRLNLHQPDGRRIAASVCGDTLYRRATDEGLVLASEPFDDERSWERLEEGTTIAHGEEGTP
jgi:glutamine amidotransferase